MLHDDNIIKKAKGKIKDANKHGGQTQTHEINNIYSWVNQIYF